MKTFVIRYMHALDGVELYHTGVEDTEDLQDAMILHSLDIQQVLDKHFKTPSAYVHTDGEYYAHEVLEVEINQEHKVLLKHDLEIK